MIRMVLSLVVHTEKHAALSSETATRAIISSARDKSKRARSGAVERLTRRQIGLAGRILSILKKNFPPQNVPCPLVTTNGTAFHGVLFYSFVINMLRTRVRLARAAALSLRRSEGRRQKRRRQRLFVQ